MICARDVEYSPGSYSLYSFESVGLSLSSATIPKTGGVSQHGDINFGSQVWEGRWDGALCYPDDLISCWICSLSCHSILRCSVD